MCVVDYEGDVCVWRGVGVRVFVVDDDGADVAVCDRLTCVVFACDCIDMIMCVRLHIRGDDGVGSRSRWRCGC